MTGGRTIHFEDWEQEFRDLDILVSSTAAPHAIVTLDKLAPFLRVHRHRPLFIIDLAMLILVWPKEHSGRQNGLSILSPSPGKIPGSPM
jgi:glutamyl-tRNA reductase